MKIKVVIKIATNEKDANKATIQTLEETLTKLKMGFSEGVVDVPASTTSARFSVGVDQ